MNKPAPARARLRIGLWLASLLLALYTVIHTPIRADMSAFLPAAPNAAQQILIDQIHSGSVSRMLLMAVAGGDEKLRETINRDLHQRLAASGAFARVANGAAENFARDQAYLFEHRYLLSARVTPERFTPPGLHAAISHSIDQLSGSAGMALKNIFLRDPSGELSALLQDLASQYGGIENRLWTSADGARSLLLAQTHADGGDLDGLQAAIALARAQFHQLRAAHGAAAQDMRLLLSGAPLFAVEARERIRSEAWWLALGSLLGVSSLLLFVYRRLLSVLTSLAPVLSGVLIGSAVTGALFGMVHGITIAFGATLIGEAVDYSIYYLVQSGTARERNWAQKFWPTIRLGVMTSVCGFAALIFSGFPGLSQLGVYSVSGLLTAAVVTRYVLPVLARARLQVDILQTLGRYGLYIIQLLGGRRQQSGVLWLSALALAVIALHAVRGQMWNDSLQGLSPVSAQAQALDEQLRADLAQPDLRYLIALRAPTQEDALQQSEQLQTALQALVEAGELTAFDSPARILPSRASQRARQAALPDAATLTERLAQASPGLAVDVARLTPFIADVERTRSAPLLEIASLQETNLAWALTAMLVEGEQDWRVLMPVRAPLDAAALSRVCAQNGAVFVDILQESQRLYGDYFSQARHFALAGLFAIVIVLAFALRTVRRCWRVLLPLGCALALTLALALLAGTLFNLLHLVGILLVVAVGSNYTLFFDRFELHQNRELVTLASLVVANWATVIGFGVLAFSSVPVLHAIGSTVAPGALLSFWMAALFSTRQASAQSHSQSA